LYGTKDSINISFYNKDTSILVYSGILNNDEVIYLMGKTNCDEIGENYYEDGQTILFEDPKSGVYYMPINIIKKIIFIK